MRSFLRSDTARGLLVSALLVCAAAAGAVVIDRHAEQHGHCAPLALIDVERAQRDEVRAGGRGVVPEKRLLQLQLWHPEWFRRAA